MQDINKSFGTNKVLKNACLNLYEGRIMALMGENGAGKSTLIKILSGLEKADKGSLTLFDAPYAPQNIAHSEACGIAVIHQELNLFPHMNILDNVFLGSEMGSPFAIDTTTQSQILVNLLEAVGLNLPPTAYIKDLSIGQQQLIEIVKALHKKAKILVMDEPTSALSKEEIDKIFSVIRMLKAQGTSIIYISHRMQEIFELCDDVTVLRDGEFIGEFSLDAITEDELIKHMVGRSIDDPFPYLKAPLRGEYLRVEKLCGDYVHDVSFSLQRGEILGVGGLMGSGRTSLMHMIYGLLPIRSGSIFIQGEKINIHNPAKALEHSLTYVSEDRKGDGLFISFPINYNTSIAALRIFSGPLGHLNARKEQEMVQNFCTLTAVKTASLRNTVGTLSGGNQQKVALARALLTGPMVLILDEPTRGIDIGARREIYTMINNFKKEGTAIILISSDMPELLSLSDRVLVMSEGKAKGVLNFEEKSPENVMKLIIA